MLYIGISIIILLCFLLLFLFLHYKNNYDFLFIKIREADNNLDLILEKKLELLLKITNILEKKKIKNIPDVIQLKSKKVDHHTFYKELNKSGNELIKIVEDHEDKIKESSMKNVLEKLEENECDLKATLKYYNDNATEINHYAHKFPANLVKIFCHYQELSLYKIERRELFEILKAK